MAKNMNIKPIPTTYNGIKYRSRLEARWAIFFDELGIKFEYELEGFEFENGKRYLPDFYLTELCTYVEIKPTVNVPVKEISKMCDLVFNDQTKRLLLICGSPGKEEMWFIQVWDKEVHIDSYNKTGVFESEEEIVSEFLSNSDNVMFHPLIYGSPRWSFAFKTLPAPIEYQLMEAHKASQFQWNPKDGK